MSRQGCQDSFTLGFSRVSDYRPAGYCLEVRRTEPSERRVVTKLATAYIVGDKDVRTPCVADV